MSILKNNKYVAKSGTGYIYSTDNNEFTGTNTFTTVTANGHNTLYKNSVYTKGTAPTTDTYIHSPLYYDKDNKLMASEFFYVPKDSVNNKYILRLYKNDASSSDYFDMLNVTVSQDGLTRGLNTAAIITATNSTSDTQIATTGWVNDYSKSTNVVHRSSEETITGAKTFTSTPRISINNPNLWLIDADATKGTAPTGTTINNAWFGTIYDKNGTAQANKLAQIYTNYTSNGAFDLNIACFEPTAGSTNNTILRIGYNSSKQAYTSVVTPTEDTTSSTQIDTVGARNTKINSTDSLCVHLAGTETITGAKTFSGANTFSGNNVFTVNQFIKDTGTAIGTANTWSKMIQFQDKNGSRTARLQPMFVDTSNVVQMGMYASNGTTSESGIYVRSNGITYAPTPSATSATTDTYIATTGWVNDASKSTNVVHRDTAEIITGQKTFNNILTVQKSTTIDWSTIPTSDQYGGWQFNDVNGKRLGKMELYQLKESGNIGVGLNACGYDSSGAIKYSGILGVWVSKDGSSSWTQSITPGAGDNSTKIATTAWCYNPSLSTNLVHRTGDETINGTKTFNSVIQGTAYRAYWGDVAEHYLMDEKYPIGTLVMFGGDKEMTIANGKANAVISENPGFILNGEMADSQPIALIGRVKVRVIGKVSKFDKLTLSPIAGIGCKAKKGQKIIGVALEDKLMEEEGLVLCSVKMNLE